MPLPADFKMSEPLSPFTFAGKVVDINPNYEPTVRYNDGKEYSKQAGQTYIDLTIEVTEGEYKGKTFVQKNINTGVYKSAKGKSQMYVFLEKAGVSADKLNALSEQRTTINFNDLINITVPSIVKKAQDENGGNFYLELRDPEVVAKKAEAKKSAQSNNDFENGITGNVPSDLPFDNQDNSEMVENILNNKPAPAKGSSLFDE